MIRIYDLCYGEITDHVLYCYVVSTWYATELVKTVLQGLLSAGSSQRPLGSIIDNILPSRDWQHGQLALSRTDSPPATKGRRGESMALDTATTTTDAGSLLVNVITLMLDDPTFSIQMQLSEEN